MPDTIKIFKIDKGYRRSRFVEVSEAYKITFLGSPTTIKYDILGKTYLWNEVVELEAGEYNYRAYSPNTNYIEDTGTFIVSGGNGFLDVTLKLKERSVVFTARDNGGSVVPDAEVTVDSKVIGKTNAGGELPYTLAVGSHTIAVRKSGFIFISESFDIPEGSTSYLKTLVMSPFVDSSKGYLSAFSSPTDAAVYLGTTLLGRTPLYEQVDEGSYVVEIRKDGYVPYTSPIRVLRGQPTLIDAKLVPSSTEGSITFTSGVQTDVFVEGTFVGTTPCTIRRPSGVYSYKGAKSGYFDVTGLITVQSGQNSAVQLSMVTLPQAPPTTYPPEGTILEVGICIGFDKFNRVANGTGGSYNVLTEKDSISCGAPAVQSVVFSVNKDATVKIMRNGIQVGLDLQTTFSIFSQKYETTPVSLTIGDMYSITVNPRTSFFNFFGGSSYESQTFTTKIVRTSGNQYINVELKPIVYIRRVAKLEFRFTEWSTNWSGEHTRGTGGLYIDSVNKTVTASATMDYDMYGPGDALGNSTGTLSLTITDPITNEVIYTGTLSNLNYYNPVISLTHSLPASASNIVFDTAAATKTFRLVSSNSADNYVDWTTPITYKWYTEAFQHLFYKDGGTIEVTINLPYSYKG